ncbi:L-histidine N(alpha)-methyltransferase [Algoriphagus marincola]|uniref:L-histidine N(alpha)-methyltransferase n=1 Tax=Algoriphagus marincola TaxID=264027 RepID=UPI000418DEE0|nr:L-histidine N(alpha)-methyltransferase [Algoriphagus marincola]
MTDSDSKKNAFLSEVLSGLNQYPKRLSSKYFYDEKGDKLFQKIMSLPEYYLTRKEFEILERQHEAIFSAILKVTHDFNLVELGAGDGLKTRILLRYLKSKPDVNFTYFPVDFSGSVLKELEEKTLRELPGIDIKPLQSSYREAMKLRPWENGKPTLTLFLGSNIGNFDLDEAKDILNQIAAGCQTHDWLLLGIDLKKDPEIILKAYNDSHGVTKEFNFNLLDRINRELSANFDRNNFKHWPTYNPITGECRSYLVSLKNQQVTFSEAGKIVSFEAFEPIWTETSRKYGISEIQSLAANAGFKVIDFFNDTEDYFTDVLWQRV